MTETMENMYEDIGRALFNAWPQNYIDYCFSSFYPIHPDSFVEAVLLEYVKYSYFESLEEHPLRYYFPYSADDDNHSERMRYARAFQYTQKFKDRNYKMLGKLNGWDPSAMEAHQYLLGKDMSSIDKRLEGYHLTEMDVFEHTNIQELGVIKSISESRISSSKKVSNKKFVELYEEYDSWVENLRIRSEKSDSDLLFSSMAFFTLEWKYSLEYIYLVADYMEKKNIQNVDYFTLMAFALPLKFNNYLRISIECDNRLVKERQYLIEDFICDGALEERQELERRKYVEIVGLVGLFNNIEYVEGGSYRDWFKNNTSLEDWASFVRDYKIFGIWHEKNWTTKKIQNARKLIELMFPFNQIK